MKVLAIVEIDEGGRIISRNPEKVYKQNADKLQIDKFFQNSENLRNQARNISQHSRDEELRLSAKFVKMGFVHESELDKFLEKKVTEIYNRVGAEFYYDYYVKRPAKKLKFRLLAKLVIVGMKLSKIFMK